MISRFYKTDDRLAMKCRPIPNTSRNPVWLSSNGVVCLYVSHFSYRVAMQLEMVANTYKEILK